MHTCAHRQHSAFTGDTHINTNSSWAWPVWVIDAVPPGQLIRIEVHMCTPTPLLAVCRCFIRQLATAPSLTSCWHMDLVP